MRTDTTARSQMLAVLNEDVAIMFVRVSEVIRG